MGAPIPEYEVMPDYITIILKALHNCGLDEPLGILEEEIRNILLKSPKITLQEITMHANYSLFTVKRAMNKLISKEIIIRVRGKRFGYWIVKK